MNLIELLVAIHTCLETLLLLVVCGLFYSSINNSSRIVSEVPLLVLITKLGYLRIVQIYSIVSPMTRRKCKEISANSDV